MLHNKTVTIDEVKEKALLDVVWHNENLAKILAEFEKHAELSGYSYAIVWLGYGLMVAEKTVAEFKDLEFPLNDVKTFDEFRAFVESELKRRTEGFVSKDWLVEWDSSTSAFSNQENKAKSKAMLNVIAILRDWERL